MTTREQDRNSWNSFDQQKADLAAEAESRKNFLAQTFAKADAERKALVARAAASFDVAEAERERVAEAARVAAHEAELREKLRKSYIVANGHEIGFAVAYPGLRADYVRAATLAGAASADVAATTTVDVARRTLGTLYGKR